MPKLRAWVPPEALAGKIIDLIQRAESKAIDFLELELRRDSVSSALANLSAVDLEFARWISDQMIRDVVTSTGEQARARADRHWVDQVSGAVGSSVALNTRPSRDQLQAWIEDNVSRIQGLREETRARIRDDLETAILSSARPEEVAANWRRQGLPTLNGTLRGRASVIARDQLATLAGQVSRAQAQALGFSSYQWDDRPGIPRKQRPVHRARRGEIFEWSSPPVGGHPGEAINCYCRAVTVVSMARLREIEASQPAVGIPGTAL